MIGRVVDWVRLVRLPNALVAGFGVVLGRACMASWLPGPAGLGFAAMALLAAAGNVHNDVLDLEADRVNRPDRALPSGRVSPRAAALGAILLALAAFACAFALDAVHGFLTLGMGLLLFLYNLVLKRLPLLGNLAVA